MAAPSGLICAWDDTVASIPTGWSRDTALDDRHLKGGTSAGATDAGHNHSIPSHTHSYAHAHSASKSDSDTASGSNAGSGSTSGFVFGHKHFVTYDSKGSTSGSAAPNTDDAGATQKGRRVIWIESDGNEDIPLGAIAWMTGTAVPSGWLKCDGTSGTPDLADDFLIGADTGNDGGSNQSAGHSHPASSHTHTGGASHSHDFQSPTGNPDKNPQTEGADTGGSYGNHTHTGSGTTGSATESIDSDTVDVTGSESSELPSSRYLYPIQRSTGGEALPKNLVMAWTGAAGSRPGGWNLCDGAGDTPDLDGGEFIIGADVDGDVDTTTGGGNHTHTTNHSHLDSHAHSSIGGTTSSTDPSSTTKEVGGNNYSENHSHGYGTVSTARTATATPGASGTATADPKSHTVIFLWNSATEQVTTDVTTTASLNFHVERDVATDASVELHPDKNVATDATVDIHGINNVTTSASIDNGSVQLLDTPVEVTASYTPAVGNSSRMVVLTLHGLDDSVDRTITSVSLGGQSMTERTDEPVGSGSETRAMVGVYTLDEAGIVAMSGTALAITWSTTPDLGTRYYAVTLSNVHQVTPIRGQETVENNAGASTLSTTALAVEVKDLILSAVAVGGPGGDISHDLGFSEGAENTWESP